MHPHMPWRRSISPSPRSSSDGSNPPPAPPVAPPACGSPAPAPAPARATATATVPATPVKNSSDGGSRSSPKPRIPWHRSSNSPATGISATAAPTQRRRAEAPAGGGKAVAVAAASNTDQLGGSNCGVGGSGMSRSSSSRSTLPPSSSSEDGGGQASPRPQRRPRPGERRRSAAEDRNGSSGTNGSASTGAKDSPLPAAATAAAAGPSSRGEQKPAEAKAGTSSAARPAAAARAGRPGGSASGNRPSYISRKSTVAAKMTAAAGQQRQGSGGGALAGVGLQPTAEQGESSLSSSSSSNTNIGAGRSSSGSSNNRSPQRAAVGAGAGNGGGARRSDKKEVVARSDRRRTRGGLEAATRITSGDVSYQIGQEIGRGGFGVVFQALNTATGDFVAVKRMEMDSVKLDAGASIKGEIDLLKKLNHPNIVQYIDTIQTTEHLHIVLEIMESSLSAMCKKFGNFSESLTAIYMTQVLEGLKYLHDQGVLHRDIKGANILTTKRGLVKLADFGVAMKLSDKQAFDVDVVGTPYWMAPEIIEMTGTTTACDVWSVGCTIIELLEGKPPYFDLPQMTALYKIVQDDHPPLPDGTSQALRDFLLQCFKKQAQMRKSSVELLRHPWLKNPTNHLRKTMKVGTVELNPGDDGTQRQAVLKTVRTAAQLMQARSPKWRHDLSENDVRDISDIANLDEAKATLLQGGPAAGQQGQGGGGASASASAPKAEAKASPLSSGAGGARRGNIPPPAAAALAAANRRGAAEDGQGWDQDWDRELGFVAPSLAVGSLPATGSGGQQQQPAAAAAVGAAETGMAPASEEAKHRLRALKEAEEQARNQPLVLKKMSLDANALDDWADDDDDDGFGDGDDDAFDAFDVAIASGNGKAGAGGGGLAGAGAGLVRGGTAPGAGGDGGGFSAGSAVGLGSFRKPSADHHPEGGVIGMEATVLRRFMEDEEEEEDAFGDIDIDVPGDGPLLPTAMGEGERSRPASFADNLKAKMLSHQGGSAAPASGVGHASTDEAAGTAVGAFDDFDDLFGTGFEDLSDGEEGGNGKEAEREMHAKVGQEVFAELSRLETRGSAAGNNSVNLRSGDGQQKGRGGGGTAAGTVPSGNDATGGVSTGRLLGTVTEVEVIDEEEEEEEEEVTMEEEVVRTCVSVCERLEGCPQARHYVMSADRGVTPLMYLMQAMKPEDRQGEEAMANVLAVINKIVEDNLKALESLAVVGLVPKVMTILETRGAWDEEEAEGETAAEAPAGSALWLPQGGEEDSSKKTDNVQQPPPRRRGSGYSSICSGNRPKMRVEAARLVRTLCNGSDLTLQTLISCGGLSVLAQFLAAGGPRIDSDGARGADARRLVRIGIDGVLKVFSLQRIRRNDFCKLFLRLGLMPRVMDTFSRFLGHSMIAISSSPSSSGRTSAGLQQTNGGGLLEREVSSMAVVVGTRGTAAAAGGVGGGDMFWPYVTRAAEILTTFSKSDGVVKEGVAEEHCLQGVMRALSSICPAYLGLPRFCSLAVTLLTVLKNLSMEPSTLEALDKAGAITTLVSLLGRGGEQQQQQQQDAAAAAAASSQAKPPPMSAAAGVMGAAGSGGGVDEDLENQVLQCMFYLCRISRKRQEKAARAGLIPHLRRCVLEQSRLKQFALQMVCDFAHTSGVVRSLMWDEGVLDFYLSVMRSPKDTHWHVTIFRSLCAWLSSEGETDRVAGRLVEPLNLDKVIFLFCTAQQVDFEEVVDKLHLMMVKSQTLVKALGSSATFIVEVMERLHYPKAVVGKTLLSMLRMIHHQHPDPAALVRDFDLYRIVLTLSRNESQVLVAELAGQLLQDFGRGGGGDAAIDTGGGGGGGGGGQKGSVGEAAAAAVSEMKPVSPSAPPPPPPPHAMSRPPPPPSPEFASAAAAACSEEGGTEEKKGAGSGKGGGRAKPREEAAE